MPGTPAPLTAITLTWFPLVARPRPPGLPLDTRIAQLTDLAAAAQTSAHERASRAAEVCNKAALIASDAALPDLARALCHQQYTVFDRARPLPPWAAKLALQPILNLPRQLIREGDGLGAWSMLQALYHAARHRTTAMIDARPIDVSTLTRAPDDHKIVCTLIWTALLADGTRALALSGRWREAADRAAERRGVGNRLLDGRQASILALLHEGRTEQANALVEHATITEPWEHVVQHLLRVLCLHAAGTDADHAYPAMLAASRALAQQADPSTTVVRTRIALISLELAAACDDTQLNPLRTAAFAAASHDAYAARDLLAHPKIQAAITPRQRHDLNHLVAACALDAGALSHNMRRRMTAAVRRAETALEGALHQE